MKDKETNFYDQLVNQYLTGRNITVATILAIVILIAFFIWNWYYRATIIVEPNIENVTIKIESSPDPNEGYTIARDEFKTYNNVNQIKLKVDPGLHYYIITSKEGYTTHQEHINPSVHQTITINPVLIEPIISQNITFPTITGDNQSIIFVNQSSNQLSSLDLNNKQITTLEEKSWYGIQEIIYSPDKTKAILKVKNDNIAFAGGFNRQTTNENSQPVISPFYKPEVINDYITTWTYNTETKELYYLNPGIRNIAWLNNEKIVYEYLQINSKIGQPDFRITNTLNIANFDGSNWQLVKTLNDTQYLTPKIIPSPTNPDHILLLPKPSEGGYQLTSAIHLLNTKNNTIEELTDKNIIDASWSPDGNNIIYNQLNPDTKKPLLYVLNINNRQTISLNLYSYIYKTHWLNSNQIAIAIPADRFQPDNLSPANIPDDYYSNPNPNTYDAIYIININNPEQKTNLFANNFQYLPNIHDIFSNDSNIYFQDAGNKLYTLPLNNI